MDLSKDIDWVADTVYPLNSTSVSTAGIVGCTVDSVDYSELEIRQFVEPLALADGLDKAGVWLGGRIIRMTGTVYDVTRGKAFDRLAVLEYGLYPTRAFLDDPSSLGFGWIDFYEPRISSTAFREIEARSNGLRVVYDRHMFGGHDSDPLAIPWSCTFYARDPTIYGAA